MKRLLRGLSDRVGALDPEELFSIMIAAFVKCSVLVPFAFSAILYIDAPSIYIPQIGLDLYGRAVAFIFLGFSLVWISLGFLRKDCSSLNRFELCYNLTPVALYMLLIFSQRHFVIGAALTLLAAGSALWLLFSLYRAALKKRRPAPLRRSVRAAKRYFVLALCAAALVPGLLCIFVYDMDRPTVRPDVNAVDALYPAADAETAPPEDRRGLYRSFRDEAWADSGETQRLNALQALLNYEAERLGMPAVPIRSERIGGNTLAFFSAGANDICIDIRHLNEAPAEVAVNSLLHETYHAYQFFLIGGIDWDAPYAGSAYFSELRSWKENSENYVSGAENFDQYERQPLEAGARAYAAEETARILALSMG